MLVMCLLGLVIKAEQCPPRSVADPGFEVRRAHFLGFHIVPPPPLRGFPEATINVYTWIIFRISICTPPPHEHFF